MIGFLCRFVIQAVKYYLTPKPPEFQLLKATVISTKTETEAVDITCEIIANLALGDKIVEYQSGIVIDYIYRSDANYSAIYSYGDKLVFPPNHEILKADSCIVMGLILPDDIEITDDIIRYACLDSRFNNNMGRLYDLILPDNHTSEITIFYADGNSEVVPRSKTL